MNDSGFPQVVPTLLTGDNSALVAWANMDSAKYTRLVDIRQQFLIDLVDQGTVTVDFVAGTSQKADLLTQLLEQAEHVRKLTLSGVTKEETAQDPMPSGITRTTVNQEPSLDTDVGPAQELVAFSLLESLTDD